jgi:hypothetical protein
MGLSCLKQQLPIKYPAVGENPLDRESPIQVRCEREFGGEAPPSCKPAAVSAQDLTTMALIDRHYWARPNFGSRRMAAWLATQGHLVNRKRSSA